MIRFTKTAAVIVVIVSVSSCRAASHLDAGVTTVRLAPAGSLPKTDNEFAIIGAAAEALERYRAFSVSAASLLERQLRFPGVRMFRQLLRLPSATAELWRQQSGR
jgi:hypothetical protein